GLTDQTARQRSRLHPTPRIELTKLRHSLLDDPTTNPHAPYKTPVTMDFAVLLYRRVAQVHAPITIDRRAKENGDGWHYTPFPLQLACQPLEIAHTDPPKIENRPSNCSSWASAATYPTVTALPRRTRIHAGSCWSSRKPMLDLAGEAASRAGLGQ